MKNGVHQNVFVFIWIIFLCGLPTYSMVNASSFLHELHGIPEVSHFPEDIQKKIASELRLISVIKEFKTVRVLQVQAAAFIEDDSKIVLGKPEGFLLLNPFDGQPIANYLERESTYQIFFDTKSRLLVMCTFFQETPFIELCSLDDVNENGWKNSVFKRKEYGNLVMRGGDNLSSQVISSIAKNSSGELLFATTLGSVLSYHQDSEKLENIFKHPDGPSIKAVSISSQNCLVCAFPDGRVDLVDLIEKKIITLVYPLDINPVPSARALCFSPDNKQLLVIYEKGIVLWNVEKKEVIAILKGIEAFQEVSDQDGSFDFLCCFSPVDPLILIAYGKTGGKLGFRLYSTVTYNCILDLKLSQENTRPPVKALFGLSKSLVAVTSGLSLFLCKIDPLSLYLIHDASLEQVLFVKFLIDLEKVCPLLKKKLTVACFVESYGKRLKEIFQSFDERAQSLIREFLLASKGVGDMF